MLALAPPVLVNEPPWSEALLVMSMLPGSKVTPPTVPCGARASTAPPQRKPFSPDSSIAPPLPASAPPRALKPPSISEPSVLSTVMMPPSPDVVASAAMRAPAATVTNLAVRALTVVPPTARARVVPMAMVPPPVAPEASILALAATRTRWLAVATIWPPLVPPRADNAPVTIALPPRASTTTRPPPAVALSAEMLPPAVTRLSMTPSTAAVVRVTLPPSARITPVLVTSAVRALPPGPASSTDWRVTSIDSRPSPYRSTTLLATPASTTWPIGAWMTPLLATCGPTSAASPACRAVMVPWFSIRAP